MGEVDPRPRSRQAAPRRIGTLAQPRFRTAQSCKVYKRAQYAADRRCARARIALCFSLKAHRSRTQRSGCGNSIVREARVIDSFLPHSAAAIHESMEKIGFSSLVRMRLESPTRSVPGLARVSRVRLHPNFYRSSETAHGGA